MLGTLLRRVTVKTLDVVVERGEGSQRLPLRTVARVLDRARGLVGLDVVDRQEPMPDWTGEHPNQHMWDSDAKKLHKFRLDKGIIKERDEEAEAEQEKPAIEVYFKRGCPSARAAMDLLREREIEFAEKDVKGDPATLSWLKIVTKSNTTPQVFVHGKSIGGFDELRELDQAGKLMDVLAPPAAEPKKKVSLPVVHPERSPFEDLADEWQGDTEHLDGDALLERVREVLDECRPLVQADGGDIELLDIQEDVVHLQLTGNCIGCPSSQATLRQGIERRLKSRIPQLSGISSPQLEPLH